MPSNDSVTDRPRSMMTSATTSRRDVTGPAGMQARYSAGVLQVPGEILAPRRNRSSCRRSSGRGEGYVEASLGRLVIFLSAPQQLQASHDPLQQGAGEAPGSVLVMRSPERSSGAALWAIAYNSFSHAPM